MFENKAYLIWNRRVFYHYSDLAESYQPRNISNSNTVLSILLRDKYVKKCGFERTN